MHQGMTALVALVVLNWNGWVDTIECLQSIRGLSYANCLTVVVDNKSDDDSVTRIREFCVKGSASIPGHGKTVATGSNAPFIEYDRAETERVDSEEAGILRNPSPDMLVLIKNDKNYGFAEGNNVAIRFLSREVKPDYVLLLNNDTVVDSGLLSNLVGAAESRPDAAVLGPKIYYYDRNGRKDIIWAAGGAIDLAREVVYYDIGQGEEDHGQHDQVREVEWCTGAAMMIRGDIARESLLNPGFQFGHEDVEYCLSIRKRGLKVLYVPGAKVWHKVSVSRKKTGNLIGRDLSGYFAFLRSNFPRGAYYYHVALFLMTTLPRWGVRFLMGERNKKTLEVFAAQVKSMISAR